MNANNHFLEAERHLDLAADTTGGSNEERYHLASAQVHATLALAAAHGADRDGPLVMTKEQARAAAGTMQGQEITDQMGGPVKAVIYCDEPNPVSGYECIQEVGDEPEPHVAHDGTEWPA